MTSWADEAERRRRRKQGRPKAAPTVDDLQRHIGQLIGLLVDRKVKHTRNYPTSDPRGAAATLVEIQLRTPILKTIGGGSSTLADVEACRDVQRLTAFLDYLRRKAKR